MEAFLQVAGVVGFVASQESLLNLMDRVGNLVTRAPINEYTDFERLKFELCKHKFHKSIQDKLAGPVSAEEDLFFNLYVKSVMRKMEEIARLKDQAASASRKLKTSCKSRGVAELLDDTLQLIDSMASWNSSSPAGSSPCPPACSFLEAETQKMQLYINLMRPQNKQPLRKKELKEKHVLLETRDDMELQRALDGLKEDEDAGRLSMVEWKSKNYIVERVEFGTNPREKERRLTRLGRLILNMREWEDPCVAKMAFIGEGQDRFYIFSELEVSKFTFLEKSLTCVDAQAQATTLSNTPGTSGLQDEEQLMVRLDEGVEKIYLLIKIASAIKKLHDQMIVHEGIGSHSVVVGNVMASTLEVKLVGFVSARMVDDMSDRPSPLLPKAERRRIVYQAPWRVAGSRYSFECDVYSLGVVMAELQCGYAFLNHLAIQGRDNILAVLNESKLTLKTSQAMSDLIQVCISPQASLVPSIDEVLQRLTYMLPP